MAEAKTFRLRTDRADWLAAEADRAEVSQNRVIEELISEAMASGYHFGNTLSVLWSQQAQASER